MAPSDNGDMVMHDRKSSLPARRLAALLIALVAAAQIVGLVVCLRAVWLEGRGVAVFFDIVALVLTPWVCIGVWRPSRGVAWSALFVMAWNATVDIWLWSVHGSWWGVAALAGNVVAFVALLLLDVPRVSGVTVGMRIFYLAVASLTGYVTFYGLLFPTGTGMPWRFMAAGFDAALPLKSPVPTLHARIIGAAYFGATVGCVRCALARSWPAAWLGTWMILLWTGILMLITVLRLDAFAWNNSPVWFWFLAYLAFPAMAGWIIWNHPADALPPVRPDLAMMWRMAWAVQGAALCGLALVMLLAPALVAKFWPWAIPPLLSQIYSGPAATFGIGSLLAARRGVRMESRVFGCAMIAFGAAGLAASLVHRGKFDFSGPATWIWFAVLVVVVLIQAIPLWLLPAAKAPPRLD